ncbi:hypothetical protein EDD99_3486 [Streptomyces sp. 846.5]|nr:hypothetical protein [Streptomyces sp. 846.5]TDU05002.1 hypothetical protein EDD99_3486 [Streptomyces sp. 846.5]
MGLTFIGIDPETNGQGSPTVWVDEDKRELVLQGWTASPELRRQVTATPAPNHEAGIPEGEDVIRIPVRMVPALRKACDAAERLD